MTKRIILPLWENQLTKVERSELMGFELCRLPGYVSAFKCKGKGEKNLLDIL
jgi:hypothetical protein